jgi:glycolate oxidase iron-sulfur subunit
MNVDDRGDPSIQPPQLAARGRGVVDRERLSECVHCGLCLSACPTYVELGTEMDSPRGRIYLMRELEDGRLPLTADVVRHIDLCLGCRACETACPSGVRYGELIESTRAYIETTYVRSRWQRVWRRLVRDLFTDPVRVRAALLPVRWAQQLGLWKLIRPLIPFGTMLPQLGARTPIAEVSPAREERGRVGFLAGCVARELCAETNTATIRVLQRNGWTVVTPAAQGCCGALHAHAGDPERARQLARGNLDAFPTDVDAIIVNAAGCGATMKEYAHLLRDDARYGERARAFAAKVRDISEFLAPPFAAAPQRLDLRVTYHEACHLSHGQRISSAPRALLRAIPGIELIELGEADVCCGSAGSYNLIERQMARRLCERKVRNIRATGATCVASANPGCTLQMRAGLRAAGLTIEVLHPVELLDRAYGSSEKGRVASDE